jgi:hypothetical protein
MSSRADVRSFQSVEAFRLALLRYAADAGKAIEAGQSQATRALQWLEGEQATYWRAALRTAETNLTRASDAYREKNLYTDASGGRQSAVDERVAMERCRRRVERCREAIDALKRHRSLLRREIDNFNGRLAALNNVLSGQIPQTAAALAAAVAQLEAYAAATAESATSSTSTPQAGGMSQPAVEPAQGDLPDDDELRRRTPPPPQRRRAVRRQDIPPLPEVPPGCREVAEPIAGPEPDRYDLVTIALPPNHAGPIYLDRAAEPADHDTGWHLGDASPNPADAPITALPFGKLKAQHPHLAALLRLPPQTMVVAEEGTVIRLTDPLGRQLFPKP